jgi:alkylation response protein AidB-like acyl-CoA dehydrogenase
MTDLASESVDAAAGVIEHRGLVRSWISANADTLDPFRTHHATTEEELGAGAAMIRVLYDAGWGRYGWPQEAGGLGGPPMLRAVLYDELERSGYAAPPQYEMLETFAPAVLAFAPALAGKILPSALNGEKLWAQGFSEPEAGSDLASLRCRAVLDGDHYLVRGQKIWGSQGVSAARMGTLVRTGSPDSRHKGLSMLMIDLDTPGVDVRPITYANGRNELAEVFFDDARVPVDRLIGAEGQGWAVAMFLLQYERGGYAWVRQAHIGRLLANLVARVDAADERVAHRVGAAWLAQQALRVRCGRTVQRLAAGDSLGPETSIDKVLLGTAEQLVCDTAFALQRAEFLHSDDAADQSWRADWFYTRASTLYGGTAEIQRGIIADRVLGLPKEGS